MKNFLIALMYDGSNYHGWQVQENAITVQSTLQDAVEKILGKRENIVGCSRTDSKVHANMFCCNMKTEKDIKPEKLKKALNALLPNDISVKFCGEVPLEFHARYDCISKEYKYLILNTDYRNPFYENRAYFYSYPIDATMLNEEIKAFIGINDFSAFCAAGSSVDDKVREIKDAKIERKGDIIEITFLGDGFLYNMVRIMVGTLLDINSGKIKRNQIQNIIKSKNRNNAGATAPPEGLYLNKVNYN
ncbi:MAG: tRNA pseudouridine(38-40) synthase TruA [Oscillospiraceae bacterium]